jgi:acetoin utilization protein AcuC
MTQGHSPTWQHPVCVTVGEALARYGFGDGHPFGPDRMGVFWQRMQEEGVDKQVHVVEPGSADIEAIQRFHTPDYVAQVQRQSQSGEGYLDYGDTPAFKGVFEAASTVAGSVLDAVRALMERRCHRAFVPIAGLHHARRDMAAGFCVFNDCGIAIEALRAKHGLRRVAYVDMDAHHGDGVFYGFEDDPELIYADIHEDGRYLYPGTGDIHETGKGPAVGTKLNVPAPPDADDGFFFTVWEQVEDFVRKGKPEFIILQCGADSIGGDPITHLRFTPAAHAHAAERLCRVADEFCEGRLLGLGGGGYNRPNLAAAWTAVVKAMLKS